MIPNPQNEGAVLETAAKLTGRERAVFLDGACIGNPALLERIQTLIAEREQSESLQATRIESNRPTPELTFVEAQDEAVGQTLGRYKLLERVGEGGCGVVYVAEQTEPVRRRVALKVIKLGMDTKQVVARFEAERQALAMMDHPNIAKVLDAGATQTGRPYFVMELVRGIPFTHYCDQNQLTTQARLKLFILVCQAIQHAHQKGIIHRDIKPSNILVTVNDGVPIPKVIDFGIAKATEGRITDNTVYTQLHQFIGTPAYMSPEQAEMTSLDIDTRSDIYSLGVLLYELLAGSTPFDAQTLMAAGIDGMRRTIREIEPSRPSTRLATLGVEQLTTTAKRRSADHAKLLRQVRGDLDWIVMKCLEKDRTRRYETANGLASDITRHLTNEPVVARPPSATYRFRKMVDRHRGVVLAGLSIGLILITAAALSTAAFIRERQARLRAAQAERERENARQATEAESIRADTVAKFVNGFLATVIPDFDRRGHRDAIRYLLVIADKLASELTNAPLAEAEIRINVALGYDGVLHEYTAAEAQYRLVERLGSRLGPSKPHLAQLAQVRIMAAQLWNRVDDTNGIPALLRLAEEAMRQSPPNTEVSTAALSEVAGFYLYYGDPMQVERIARDVLRIAPDDTTHLYARNVALNALMTIYRRRGSENDTERAADELIASVNGSSPRDRDEIRKRLYFFAMTLWDYDPSIVPRQSLERALKSVPEDQPEVRTYLEALTGIAIARDGDWGKGLRMLSTSATNSVESIQIWRHAAQLAALAGNHELHRTLVISGVARFASAADGEASQFLLEALLMFTPEARFLPTIHELVARTSTGAPWVRANGNFWRALLKYRMADFREALDSCALHQREGTPIFRRGMDPLNARSWFLRSMIERQLGHLTLASDAYAEAMRFHSSALAAPGAVYTGDLWSEACTAELLRREATQLLGKELPVTPK